MTPGPNHLPSFALSLLLLASAGCHEPVAPWPADPIEPAPVAARAATDAAVALRLDPTDLEPGSVRAFGLVMPLGAVEHVSNDDTRGYSIAAPMPRVMRYLERRLEIGNAEIHPLGALMRGAHLRATPAGENLTLDIGVRGEGDQTLVTIWNRTTQALPPRTPEEGFRAAGFDPRTGRALPQNNY